MQLAPFAAVSVGFLLLINKRMLWLGIRSVIKQEERLASKKSARKG